MRIFDKYAKESVGTQTATLCAMVAICVVARLLPHPPNVTPVAAMALFAGATLANVRWALLVPCLAMVLSDMLIGMHSLALLVYACMMVNVGIGRWLHTDRSAGRVLAASLLGTTFFFLATNLGHWWAYSAHTIPSLITTYVAAIPFYGNALVGDLGFTTLAFGTFAWVHNRRRGGAKAWLSRRQASAL